MKFAWDILKKLFIKFFGKIGYLFVNNNIMKKVKLTESDLTRIIKRVINEQSNIVRGERPTDDASLYQFLKNNTDMGDEEIKFMARVLKEIQSGNINKDRGIYDFNKKFPNSVIPSHLLLFLL